MSLRDKYKNEEEETEEKSLIRFTTEVFVVLLILIGIPFLLGGVWPPFVSIISESMEPNLQKGELVYIIEANEITTAEDAEKTIFNEKGDVIVFYSDGNTNEIQVIHRAKFWVEEGDNWVEKADEDIIGDSTCYSFDNCPANNDGYITIGDNNDTYDQASGISEPVKEEWIVGKAAYSIPYLGWFNIIFESIVNAIFN